MEKSNVFKKYKWLYLWVSAVALVILALIMFLNGEVGRNIVYYISGAFLIIFVIIRLIPFVKTSRDNWAIVINIVEMLADLTVGILLFVLTIKNEGNRFDKIFPFLIGGVIYLRGVIYFVEITFLKTKAQPLFFVIHLACLTLATYIMALYEKFDANYARWVFAIIFALGGVYAIVDGIINYNHFRTQYILPKVAQRDLEKEKEEHKDKDAEIQKDDGIEAEIIVPEKPENQDYIN